MSSKEKLEAIADLIETEVSYFNGWHVSEDAMKAACMRAAKKVIDLPSATEQAQGQPLVVCPHCKKHFPFEGFHCVGLPAPVLPATGPLTGEQVRGYDVAHGNSLATTEVLPLGLMITREVVPSFAKRLADDLFTYTKGDIYKYLPDSSAKERFAESIGNYLHVLLNQIRVSTRDCKHCGKPQQEHDWVGGYCCGGNRQKFEAGD